MDQAGLGIQLLPQRTECVEFGMAQYHSVRSAGQQRKQPFQVCGLCFARRQQKRRTTVDRISLGTMVVNCLILAHKAYILTL